MSIHTPDHFENEAALHIFREISKSPKTTQRELSSRLGISLGKVNFLIKALMRMGFVRIENFKKTSNKTAYLYYLTPMGIEEKSRLTYHFLKRKVRKYTDLELEIQRLREEVRLVNGDSALLLIGANLTIRTEKIKATLRNPCP